MKSNTLVFRSLRFFSRSHLALALGIASAVAVIVGALVVGDSVRRSLRGLVVDRLGSIESLLHSRTYFDPSILESLRPADANLNIVPAIILSRSSAEHRDANQFFRASNVQVLAVDAAFWDAAKSTLTSAVSLEEDQVAVNASLANELSLAVGDELTLRISNTPGAPADNPLGKKDDAIVSLPRQKVVAILPDDSLGGATFVVGQSAPKNVYCSLATLQDVLDCDAEVNAAFVLSQTPSLNPSDASVRLCDQLNLQLTPQLEDYGLQLARHTRVYPDAEIDKISSSQANRNGAEPPEQVFDYYQLSADELIIDDQTANTLSDALGSERAFRMITYLANGIEKIEPLREDVSRQRSAIAYEARLRERRLREQQGEQVDDGDPRDAATREPSIGTFSVTAMELPDEMAVAPPAESRPEALSRTVPYSIVVGTEYLDALNLRSYTTVPMEELRVPFCWINSWLAEQIDAEAGDWFRLKFFQPETVEGQAIENEIHFMIAGIVPITEPAAPFRRLRPAQYSERPTVFNDSNLTPSVPGVTDQDSISKWDLPFPLQEDLILDPDDAYWNNHRLTPKIFVPYDMASRSSFFGSRFGRMTAFRIPANTVNSEAQLRNEISEALLPTRAMQGLVFSPVRHEQLQAASGATPFDMLFLSLSFFVIVAALLLVTLLLKLGIARRAEQIGVLYAQGYSPQRVRQILMREYACVGLAGAGLGTALGIGYARLMIAGLQTWWLGAISTPFLRFSFGWQSIAMGFAAGFVTCLVVVYLGLRKLSRVTPLSLLRGRTEDQQFGSRRKNRVLLAVAGFAAMAAIGLMAAGLGLSGMARAGTFFGSGMLVLIAILVAMRHMIEGGREQKRESSSMPLFVLAWRAISRNAVRSTLALGLLSVASFLIASMGVFQVAPNKLGYGGFDLLGESSQPIFINLASTKARAEVMGAAADDLRGSVVIPMRLQPGEDASCNNLFQVARPTILGVPRKLRDLTDLSPESSKFSWAATEQDANPWRALENAATGSEADPIPVILDQNTAAWSLKQGAGLGAIIRIDEDDRRLHFKTVGLLSNSVLQGKLMISQNNFESAFPNVSGYRFFMIRSPSAVDAAVVTEAFENGWNDQGLDITYSETTLEQLLGVQNTYISAFQTLGALGLLLGTFGLAAVQLRSVIERRRELALMQAVGFSKSRIIKMLTLETAIILTAGILIGVASATIALVPYVLETGPQLSLLGPLASLTLVLAVGFLAAILAVRKATSQSVLDGLRAE